MLGDLQRDRRSERREATRDEIVAAAWELCRPEGLGALSLRDLAKRVGMQAPSLYSYFDSKHAIYDAMYADGARAFVAAQGEMVLSGDSLHDLKAVARFFIGFCTEDPVRYQLLFQRVIPGFEPSPESFAISVASLREMQEHFASIGLTDPEAVDLYTALGTGLADQQISNDPGGDRWIRLVDEAMEMLHAHLVRRAESKRGGVNRTSPGGRQAADGRSRRTRKQR
ncbi:MAG: TetR/AcrR family transcriptional regulator [Acidimicrobiales bacterium]|nr:TetR/AcrR family transcriptional regulator [Acidimicrobiales bacterium]